MAAKITKSLISKLEANPHEEGLKMDVNLLETLIEKAINAYYNTDKPLLEDDTYDILENILREKKPTSKVFDKVGAAVVNPEDAVKLPYYLGSMDKVKPGEKVLTRWLSQHPGEVVISEKLDGLSALLMIELGKTGKDLQMTLYKHGDGNEGQDISKLLKYVDLGKYNVSRVIDIVKSTAKKHIALRGEIIITKDKYEDKYTQVYPKARSLIAGIVNSKTIDENIAKDMQIVFYELINPGDMKYSEQFSKIHELGFNVAMNKIYKDLTEQMLPEILFEYKKNTKYEIDGIILADNTQAHERVKSKNPKYAVAFKMALSDQIATTTIENIEYNISKHGALCPRILYKSVVIKGDTHQYTSGFNLRYIIDNKLGPGAEIQIIKSGDVIPYIYNIIKPAKEPQMPDKSIKWHWNNTEIDAIVDDLETNEDVRTRRIISFFSVMKIAGVGPGNVDKLVNAGYDQIKTILELTPDVIALVDGFQLKSATNVYNSIHKVIDLPQPLERVMAASNIFGVGLGERKFKMIFDKIPNFFNKWTSGKLDRASIMDVEGFSDKTADLFIAGMPKFVDWLKLHSMIKIESDDVKKADIPKGNKYAGAVVVFTGVRDTALEKEIESQGGKIGSGVTGKTTLLVAKDTSENSSKIQKANELGIQIVAYDDFIKNK